MIASKRKRSLWWHCTAMGNLIKKWCGLKSWRRINFVVRSRSLFQFHSIALNSRDSCLTLNAKKTFPSSLIQNIFPDAISKSHCDTIQWKWLSRNCKKTRCSRDIEKYYSSFKTLRLKSMNFKSLSRNGIKRFIHSINGGGKTRFHHFALIWLTLDRERRKKRFCYADVASRQKLLLISGMPAYVWTGFRFLCYYLIAFCFASSLRGASKQEQ